MISRETSNLQGEENEKSYIKSVKHRDRAILLTSLFALAAIGTTMVTTITLHHHEKVKTKSIEIEVIENSLQIGNCENKAIISVFEENFYGDIPDFDDNQTGLYMNESLWQISEDGKVFTNEITLGSCHNVGNNIIKIDTKNTEPKELCINVKESINWL